MAELNKEPLITIITPNYNMGNFIEETINSVLNQSYANLQYIIIDGGSTDKSLEIIKRYEDKLDYWISEPDTGQSQAINKGFLRAKGEFVGWLNSDDVLTPNSVETVVREFQKYPELDVIYGRNERINWRGDLVPTPDLPKDKNQFDKNLILSDSLVNQPGLLFKRKWLGIVGLLNEDLNYVMDYEYWVRLAIAGARFRRIPNTLARFRLNEKSKTVNNVIDMTNEHLRVLNEIASSEEITQIMNITPDELKAKIRDTKAILYLYLSNGYRKKGEFSKAIRWFIKSIQISPKMMLQKRWLDLAIAKVKR